MHTVYENALLFLLNIKHGASQLFFCFCFLFVGGGKYNCEAPGEGVSESPSPSPGAFNSLAPALITICVVDGRLDVNVALNRPSWLSSTFTSDSGRAYPASKGNDGDKSNCKATTYPHSVAHTETELNPWFGVDLGVALYVAGVRFTNRAKGWGKCIDFLN